MIPFSDVVTIIDNLHHISELHDLSSDDVENCFKNEIINIVKPILLKLVQIANESKLNIDSVPIIEIFHEPKYIAMTEYCNDEKDLNYTAWWNKVSVGCAIHFQNIEDKINVFSLFPLCIYGNNSDIKDYDYYDSHKTSDFKSVDGFLKELTEKSNAVDIINATINLYEIIMNNFDKNIELIKSVIDPVGKWINEMKEESKSIQSIIKENRVI